MIRRSGRRGARRHLHMEAGHLHQQPDLDRAAVVVAVAGAGVARLRERLVAPPEAGQRDRARKTHLHQHVRVLQRHGACLEFLEHLQRLRVLALQVEHVAEVVQGDHQVARLRGHGQHRPRLLQQLERGVEPAQRRQDAADLDQRAGHRHRPAEATRLVQAALHPDQAAVVVVEVGEAGADVGEGDHRALQLAAGEGVLVQLQPVQDRRPVVVVGKRQVAQEIAHPGGHAQWPGPAAVAERRAPALAGQARIGENRPARQRRLGHQRALGIVEPARQRGAGAQRFVAPRRVAQLAGQQAVQPVRVGRGHDIADRQGLGHRLVAHQLRLVVFTESPMHLGLDQQQAQPERARRGRVERRLGDRGTGRARQLDRTPPVALAQVPCERDHRVETPGRRRRQIELELLERSLVDDKGHRRIAHASVGTVCMG